MEAWEIEGYGNQAQGLSWTRDCIGGVSSILFFKRILRGLMMATCQDQGARSHDLDLNPIMSNVAWCGGIIT